MIRTYYRGAHVAFLVYDTTSGTSLENLRKWVYEVELYAPSTVVKVLVGTKSDLVPQRTVSTDQAQNFADKLGIPHIETSSKDDVNVLEAFTLILPRLEPFATESVPWSQRRHATMPRAARATVVTVFLCAKRAETRLGSDDGPAQTTHRPHPTLADQLRDWVASIATAGLTDSLFVRTAVFDMPLACLLTAAHSITAGEAITPAVTV
eukprot:m.237862 g.237862  ORF g.237862 m.237862 type:complete len:208 (+) comp15800_c0_seq6:561-1184(+)